MYAYSFPSIPGCLSLIACHSFDFLFLLPLRSLATGNMFFNTLILAALTTTTLASPISNPRVVHQKREIISSVKGPRIDEDAIIPIRIGLKQSNLEHGYDMVMDVSDPHSENYGNYKTTS